MAQTAEILSAVVGLTAMFDPAASRPKAPCVQWSGSPALTLNCPARLATDQQFQAYAKATYYLTTAASELGHHSVTALNDETDHTTVMKMFDLAIDGAEHDAAAAATPEPKVVEVGTAYDGDLLK